MHEDDVRSERDIFSFRVCHRHSMSFYLVHWRQAVQMVITTHVNFHAWNKMEPLAAVAESTSLH